MEHSVETTWKPTTAGILNIITGVISGLGALVTLGALVSLDQLTVLYGLVPAEDLDFIASFLNSILILFLVLSISHTVFPLLAGILAIKRKKWGWTLAGSVIAILVMFPLGVASTIFVAMSRDEFDS